MILRIGLSIVWSHAMGMKPIELGRAELTCR